MQIRSRDIFTTIRTEGAILPPNLLQLINNADRNIEGLDPDTYHLGKGEKLNEAINRSWNRLLGAWSSFRVGESNLPQQDNATSLTRERWLLILFQELGYGRLLTSKAIEIEGKNFAVSHMWQNTPIHLIGCRIELDRRTAGVAGASRVSPHGLIQEFLNRSDAHLWGFVSNGLSLRILRDNANLTRQAYVEFDLQSMMEGEIYSDFVLLWLLCHESRVEADKPENCWLEKWSRKAQEQGTRAMEQLRDGVEKTISTLGAGFLGHPNNRQLRENLYSGELSTQDYYRQLLRLVYRLIFLFVAENRNLLLNPSATNEAKERYLKYYSMNRLRSLAEKRRGTGHTDLFVGFKLVMQKLNAGCPELGLPALGSFLWSERAIPDLIKLEISNQDLLEAIYALVFVVDSNARRPVDYKNLGAEELGSVYESLLELHPILDTDSGVFKLDSASGNERKTSGSYYTPTGLINSLLDSALEPVLNDALKQKEPEKAIMSLKVCDPACGSGHFLIAAAHRIAKRLASVRTGDNEPSPEAQRTALRDVIGHCIYGVDINEMAVELCKVSLWMEAMEPGKPLAFLDHHIKCGNSLIGSTPALLKKAIPDDVFKPIEGDDKDFCKEYRSRNRKERRGNCSLFAPDGSSWEQLGDLGSISLKIANFDDSTLDGLRHKVEAYSEFIHSSEYLSWKLLYDVWCAAFFWEKRYSNALPYPITQEIFDRLNYFPNTCPHWMQEEVIRLARQYQFFHWHLEFPDVFTPKSSTEIGKNEITGWLGGFDCVLGNPPWEKIQCEEKGFFELASHEIAGATGAIRKRMIKELEEKNQNLFQGWSNYRRFITSTVSFIKASGKYPLTGFGKINSYAIFAELAISSIHENGRTGLIVPLGIATDDTTKLFFSHMVESGKLVSLYGFENEAFIFPAIHHSYKFCLFVTLGSETRCKTTDFVFFCRDVDDLKDKKNQCPMSAADIKLLNPNTKTCPTFRLRQDYEIIKYIYNRIPIISPDIGRGDWDVQIHRILNPTDDSELMVLLDASPERGEIQKINDVSYVRVYESKMIHLYDHRFGTYVGQTESQANQGKLPELSRQQHNNPCYFSQPRNWISSSVIEPWLEKYTDRSWLLAYRDITSAVVLRTVIATVIPKVAPVDPCRCIFFPNSLSPLIMLCFLGALNSFALDFIARQSVSGTHLAIFVLRQLPVPNISTFETRCRTWGVNSIWISYRVLELTYTAWDIESFAYDCNYIGPPFIWDEDRRFLIRAEIDAALFHIYLGNEQEWKEKGSKDLLNYFPTPRHVVEYIMDTFRILRERDEAAYGKYRTKDTILDIYDKMARVSLENTSALAASREANVHYQTRLNPPPGPLIDVDGNFISMYYWDRDNWPTHIHSTHPEWEESLLSAWFAICQKRWSHFEDDQIFPWDGREAFVYALIPYLIQKRSGEKFEFYRDTALLASHSERCKTLLLSEELRNEYCKVLSDITWLDFPEKQRVRSREIREKLQNKRIIQTDSNSGASIIDNDVKLPPLPKELKMLLPLLLNAGDNLEKLQRQALDAKAVVVNFTWDEVANEFNKLMVI